MANKNKTCFFCMFLFLLFSFWSTKADQLQTLLSFRSSVYDPLHTLSSWGVSNADTTGSFFCNWYGVTCNSSHVIGIQLSGKNLSGDFPRSIVYLQSLETLNIGDNNFSGEIPAEIFAFSNIRYLNLSNNNFSGPIPRTSSPTLETLDLSNNMLSGEIPANTGLFSKLQYLDLGGNVLTGTIPAAAFSRLTRLRSLTLASNQLTGTIPPEIGRLSRLEWIYLGYNNFSGKIPAELGHLSSLNHLDLVYNNLTGSIPHSLGNLKNLQYLFLYQNKLTNSIPRSIFNLTKLVSLDLSDNFLTGDVPESIVQLQKLEILHLFSNNLTGSIPKAVASLPRLQVLQLWKNSFFGDIPADLGRKSNLTALDLSTNFLTGKIPAHLCDSQRLFKLILFSNSLAGPIPETLNRCSSLQRIRIEKNKFSGRLSPEFTKLPLVYYLDVSGNKFSGSIASQKWNLPSLQMLNLARNKFTGNLPESFGSSKLENLDMSENQFSGFIPSEFGKFSELTQLKLSRNQLSGPIPDDIITGCRKLVSFDVSNNQLTGRIPADLSDMPVLGELDLSENKFSGQIPPDLGKVDSLVFVNVSYNHLHGGLPITGAFLAINASAVAGNDGLCGTVSSLPRCNKTEQPIWRFAVTAVAAILLLFAIGFLLALFFRRRESQLKKVDTVNTVWDFQIFSKKVLITVSDVLNAMKEDNLISKGRNGALYRGITAVRETEFAVKELTGMPSFPATFWAELAESGKLKHPNIVKLLGICKSETDGILIYEFLGGNSLSDVLHGNLVGKLGWKARLRIAAGIASALEFLHCRCFPRILHGNITSEKVILDGQDEPHLKLNLPGSLRSNSKGYLASGCVAPEVINRKEFTEKSDIYSFGVLLIELLTGKRPLDPELGAHDNIVDWAHFCSSNCYMDTWLDLPLKENVSDYHSEIVETMSLAISCTAVDPSARPSTTDILKTLESIRKPESWISRLKFLLAV